MVEEWSDMEFSIEPYGETGTYTLSSVDSIQVRDTKGRFWHYEFFCERVARNDMASVRLSPQTSPSLLKLES